MMKSLRIGIDFHVAGGIYQGVRTYLTNLMRGVLEIENEFEYFVYADNPGELTSGGNRHRNMDFHHGRDVSIFLLGSQRVLTGMGSLCFTVNTFCPCIFPANQF